METITESHSVKKIHQLIGFSPPVICDMETGLFWDALPTKKG
jgi:hypothetical protein